jgi:hypothetical protein
MATVSRTMVGLPAGAWVSVPAVGTPPIGRHRLQIVASQPIDVQVLDAAAGNIVAGPYLGQALPLDLLHDSGRVVQVRHPGGGANAMATWSSE